VKNGRDLRKKLEETHCINGEKHLIQILLLSLGQKHHLVKWLDLEGGRTDQVLRAPNLCS
jgi:hypothetical protein